MRDPSVRTLFEAAFSYEGINIRADILTKNDDGTFDLVEVKSSTSFKPEHLPDIAIQQHVLEGLGYPTRKTGLMHIDNTYVYGGGDYDLSRLFSVADTTDQSRAYSDSDVPSSLDDMWKMLSGKDEPAIGIGPPSRRQWHSLQSIARILCPVDASVNGSSLGKVTPISNCRQ